MDVEERKAILESMSLVANIFVIPGDKDSACDGIRECLKYYTEGYRPSDMKRRDYLFIFANGGDRINANTPEIETCTELGVCLLWGLGSKIQSSSDLTRRYAEE